MKRLEETEKVEGQLALDLRWYRVEGHGDEQGVTSMKLPCMQCRERFSSSDFLEIPYCDEGIYFFCSKECRDIWTSPRVPVRGTESLQQDST